MRHSVARRYHNKLINVLRAQSKNHKSKSEGEKGMIKLVEMEEGKAAQNFYKTILLLEPNIINPLNDAL